jgi:ppGpp synthetase/RelA/SpoT-type nucleotidyltranferase
MAKFSNKKVHNISNVLRIEDSCSNPELFDHAMQILSYWRFTHESSLDIATKLLESRCEKIDKNFIVGKRLKRSESIINKLIRFEDMSLRNMSDIGGARAILSNIKRVNKVVRELQSHPSIYRKRDYINKPKDDGYRGVHLLGEFSNNENQKRKIEIQIRTKIQHSWATTIEIVDLFTSQSLKSNIGHQDWKEFFLLIAKQFNIIELLPMYGMVSDKELLFNYAKFVNRDPQLLRDIGRIKEISLRLSIRQNLLVYAESLKQISISQMVDQAGYFLLRLNTYTREIWGDFYSKNEAEKAAEHYSFFESTIKNSENRWVVVLVSSNSIGDIKEAYPNYFADSADFINLLNMIHFVNTKNHYQPSKSILMI